MCARGDIFICIYIPYRYARSHSHTINNNTFFLEFQFDFIDFIKRAYKLIYKCICERDRIVCCAQCVRTFRLINVWFIFFPAFVKFTIKSLYHHPYIEPAREKGTCVAHTQVPVEWAHASATNSPLKDFNLLICTYLISSIQILKRAILLLGAIKMNWASIWLRVIRC